MPKRNRLHQQRRWINRLAIALALVAVALGLMSLFWILWEIVRLGFGGLSWMVFTQMTPAPNEAGGLLNAIYGSLVMVVLATLLGTPLGVMAGVYLVEFGPKTKLGAATRFINDILLSAPSVVIGLFVYGLVVMRLKGFSALAGVVALSFIVIPVVVRTTEGMLCLVPHALREAAYALGTPRWRVVLAITLRSARSGVITGVLLAVARIAGETAPLLFTALNNQFWNTDLTQPMASLSVVIFKFAMSPYENWQQLAWTAVFIITAFVLGLNVLARWMTRKRA